MCRLRTVCNELSEKMYYNEVGKEKNHVCCITRKSDRSI